MIKQVRRIKQVAGGGSGAYISDKVFTVTEGETISVIQSEAGGAPGNQTATLWSTKNWKSRRLIQLYLGQHAGSIFTITVLVVLASGTEVVEYRDL
jgi:hypothetical protein